MNGGLNAIVAGGTGLVGRALIDALEEASAYASVTSLVRRARAPPATKLTERVIAFDALSPADIPEGATTAFCTLGTTIKTAGSRDAFRRVDFEYVLAFARACAARGVTEFHVVSSMGADADSRVFYNSVKGEMEGALREVPFDKTCVYRPSLLLGDRSESRFGEQAGALMMRALRPVIPEKYRAIPAETVARAMANNATRAPQGFNVYESDAIRRLARDAR